MWNRFEGKYQSFSEGVAARWKPALENVASATWESLHASRSVQFILRNKRVFLGALITFVLGLTLATLALTEARTSRVQAWYFSSAASDMTFHLEAGRADRMLPAADGPYDHRLGYAAIPQFIDLLTNRSFEIAAQSRPSSMMHRMAARGIYPIYHPKQQAGLTIRGNEGELLYEARFPRRVYADFDSIPPILVKSLLFIENRTLLDDDYPYRNPAVEWNRLGKAVMDKALATLGSKRSVPGASTLATQLEKVRHSPEGRTDSAGEKFRQMASASFRTYLDGPETIEAQRRIILEYVNAVPLAAAQGYGEVIGLGDGMWAWYGADFDEYNRLLTVPADALEEEELMQRAVAYRQALSLFLAHRRPSYYLIHPDGRRDLALLTSYYAELLAGEGVIPASLKNQAVEAVPELRSGVPESEPISFIERKAPNAIRMELLSLLGMSSTYDLDHMDLEVHTTFNHAAQESVAEVVKRLHDRSYVNRAGLTGFRLISGDPADVNYAIVLYERTPEGNLLRLQTDNFEGPLNINEGTKLELGSTAKLRTLVNYLQIINEVYERHAGKTPAELRDVDIHRRDQLTRWTVDYLRSNPDTNLENLLRAAMLRRYSAATGERFYTGGGLHSFRNFDGTHEGAVITVTEAFRHSVNLVFIRMMRDIVYHYAANLPGNPLSVLDDANDPRRQEYLSRFADKEGRHFLNQFYRKYQGREGAELLQALREGRNMTPRRLAWSFRTVRPDASLNDFLAYAGVPQELENAAARPFVNAFERSNVEDMSWADLGHLVNIHPLELWLVRYLYANPGAPRADIMNQSADVRQDVYEWLFRLRNRASQNNRIWQIIEEDAFVEVHRAWRRVGYPFGSLVPSYATSIGSSADRPDALADLVGIIVNDGVHMPTSRIKELHFAENTPYETVLRRELKDGVRVLSPELSAVVREAMVDVVDRGTARRVSGSMRTSDGEILPVGAKTGTGDNRVRTYARGGAVIQSRALNRTSTLVFFIGDRYFGTITVFVSGREADRHGFTSSLPSQLLRHLAPSLQPLLDAPPYGEAADLAALAQQHEQDVAARFSATP